MDGEKTKVFALSEVSQHNNSKDCWFIIHGKVYDVTKFMDDHTGSDEVILSSIGKDATDDFEDVGHSSSARMMMDKYYIGDADTSTIPVRTKYAPPKQAQCNQGKTPGEATSVPGSSSNTGFIRPHPLLH